MSEQSIGYTYKYTDRDVREDPRLAELATAYLRTYGGEFAPLIEAKTYLRVVGPMPDQMVRTVLNCMRHDANVAAQMPAPQRPSLDVDSILSAGEYAAQAPRRRSPRPPAPVRRAPFFLPTTWHHKYIVATTTNAKVFHHLDPVRSKIKYYPAVWEFQARAETFCGQNLASGVHVNQVPEGRYECRQCARVIQKLKDTAANRQAVRDDLERFAMSELLREHSTPQQTTSEKARLAVRNFNRMLPALNSYVRVFTGNPKARIVVSACSNGATDGTNIFYRPPIALGSAKPHQTSLCDKRAESGVPRCPACALREDVLVTIYHEIGHIAEGTFDDTTPASKQRALEIIKKKYGNSAMYRRIESQVGQINSYLGLARSVSPWMQLLLNSIEDARVNERLFQARPGLRLMFEVNERQIFEHGVEQKSPTGEIITVEWRDYPLNMQAVIAIFCKLSGYDFRDWLCHKVVADLYDDEVLNQLTSESHMMKRVEDAYVVSFAFLDRLKALGYLMDEGDPEPEPQPEPEQEEKDDDSETHKADEADEASEGESKSDKEEENSPEAGNEDDSGAGGIPEGDEDADRDGTDSSDDEGLAGSEEVSDVEPFSGSDDDNDDPGQPETGDKVDAGSDSDEGSGGEPGSTSDESGTGSDPGDVEKEDGRSDDGEDMADDGGDESRAGDAAKPGESDPDGSGGEADAEGEGDPGESGDAGGEPGSEGATRGAGSTPDSGGASDRSDAASDELDSASSECAEDSVEGNTPDQADSGGLDDGSVNPESPADPSNDGSPSPNDTDNPTEGTGDPLAAPLADDGGDGDHQHQPDHDDPPMGDDVTESEPVDTLAAPNEGGIVVHGDEPEYGTVDEVRELMGELHAIQMHGEKPDELHMDAAQEKAVTQAVLQEQYFETDSRNIMGVMEMDEDQGRGWEYYKESSAKMYGCGPEIEEQITPDATTLGPSLVHMRIAFSENKRSKHRRNLKSGKVNTSALGKRAPVQDERLFKRKLKPKKRDYFVVICMDLSGSTVGLNLILEKRAVMAQAELLSRLGVDFVIVGESGEYPTSEMGLPSGSYLSMYQIKKVNEPWSAKIKQRLANIGPVGANLDGHALEYCRKLAAKSTASDKVILYYSDGKMPAENYDEELEILQREIRTCKQQGIALLGVGIRTDSPTRHGLDTVQVDDDSDIVKVVKQIERKLNEV